HSLEEYMASYMRERGADAMLVLRNENKWAMTGKYSDIFSTKISVWYILSFKFNLLSVIFVAFSCFSR
ncbi:MAG: hypothetical protein ACK56I_12095, partial [bacterium]